MALFCGHCILEAGYLVGTGKQGVLWRYRMCIHDTVVHGAWGLILGLASHVSKLNKHSGTDLLLSIRIS